MILYTERNEIDEVYVYFSFSRCYFLGDGFDLRRCLQGFKPGNNSVFSGRVVHFTYKIKIILKEGEKFLAEKFCSWSFCGSELGSREKRRRSFRVWKK